MTHDDAVKSMAAERYALDEMEPAERDAFEQHFFDCSDCAEDVRDAEKFAAGVRSDGRVVVPIPVPRRSYWLPMAASVLFVALSAESFWMLAHRTAPAQNAPASFGEMITLESTSRGTNDRVVKVIHGDEAVALTFAIETDQPQTLYTCEVRDAAGKTRATLSVPRDKASEPVLMVLQPHTLSGGNYNLVIRGGEREIAAYPFTVEVR
jgi:hypothetical protein